MATTSSSSTAVRLVLLLAAAVVLFALISYYNQRKSKGGNERFVEQRPQLAPMSVDNAFAPLMPPPVPAGAASPAPSPSSSSGGSGSASFGAPTPIEPFGNEKYLPVGGDASAPSPRDPFPADRVTPDQLLPKDAVNTKWAQANPAGQGDVKDQNYLTAGYHVGFDTQGSSLRNASHDIRSTPPNPRYRVSIWQNSGIEPDLNRRPLE
jgi:hypothetical protein